MAQGEERGLTYKAGSQKQGSPEGADFRERGLPHKITLQDRRLLTVTGVSEVMGFSDEAAALRTSRGLLLVRGQNLKLKLLTPDGGQVALEGTVTALEYEESRREGGFFSRLFG